MVKKWTNSLVLVKRMAALRIAPAYRTVSVPAVHVIAGTIHVDLLTVERIKIYMAKSVENHITGHFREYTMKMMKKKDGKDLSRT